MASKLKLTELLYPTSTTPAITINADDSVTIPTLSMNGGALSPQTGFKNRIINGAMTIDQRNAGASVTPATTNTFTLDRWICGLTQASKFSVQQNAGAVTPPTGFKNYAGITSTSSYAVTSSDAFFFEQRVEGFNVADLGFGTAAASTVTVSFMVRSSLTGTFGGCLRNGANTRSYPFAFTIVAANTWEQKTITVAGDTSGTWLSDNGSGLKLTFGLGSGATYAGTAGAWATAEYYSATGATSVVGTNGATFYITGVQLEKGSVATPFEFRSIGTELGLCQRYAIGFPFGSVSTQPTIAVGGTGLYWDANSIACSMNGSNLFNMRTVPTTITSIGTQGTDWGFQTSAGVTQTGFTLSTNHGLVAGHKTSHGLGANNVSLRVLTSAGNIIISSEL